jgi:L-rhamnose mutarotase
MMTIRHCFALDLKDKPELIKAYKKHHSAGNVWPEIIESIKSSGIDNLDIYLVGNRLFMIMDVNDEFSFTLKDKADLTNPKVVAWEDLMWTFQQQLPWAKGDEKWMLMEQIFTLK